MSVSREFTELLLDLMSPLGPISVRRMFGGAGLFRDGLMFALLADDTLYLKADEASRATFETEGLGAFTYTTSNGPRSIMSYWRAPERVLDDPEEMQAWCRMAMEAARRADAGSTSRKRRSIPGMTDADGEAAGTGMGAAPSGKWQKAGRKRPAR